MMTKTRWIVASFCLCVLGILFFGLRPIGYSFANEARWIEGRTGLRFGKYGVAHATVPLPGLNHDKARDFSVELVFQPARRDDKRFQSLLMLHGGKDTTQFIIGQWRSSIIIMNGSNYDGSAAHQTIYATGAISRHRPCYLSFTSGDGGSCIYIDGQLVKEKRHMHLRLPYETGGRADLVLGNGIYGERGWRGEVYGLTLYRKELSESRIIMRHKYWLEKQNVTKDEL